MTEIENLYFNNREALIDEICELEEEISQKLLKDTDPAEFYPRFAEMAQQLCWINPVVYGRENISLKLQTPMSHEGSELLAKEEEQD